MKWSQEKVKKMIKDLKSMEKGLEELTKACDNLVKETEKYPSFEEQLNNIIKIQGEKYNE